jgi:L-threonylcarbamoyladenylate synthase
MPQTLKINPRQPEYELVRQAMLILQAGGVVAYPTETFYGLAVDAMNGGAIERIFQIKGRQFSKPIALIAGSKYEIGNLVAEIPVAAQRLMRAFWPGPLTLLFSASLMINPRLTAGTGKIGIRVSSHPIADNLANSLSGPITATSANLSGAPECRTAGEVLTSLSDQVDLIIDGGPAPGGKGSTFMDITTDPPACLREGAIPLKIIQDALNGIKENHRPQ